jgi:DNA-binding NtrC family response regulator
MNAAATVSDAPSAAPRTVLVVEDEVLIRLAVSDYLRECGYQVIEASNADEAVRVLSADIKVDVVFSDVNMPGSIDGFGLAQWVRRERAHVKVILASGAARSAQAAGGLCEKGPFLRKPYAHAELERQIRALLER